MICGATLKIVSSENVGGSGAKSTLGTWYGDVVMGILLSLKGLSLEIDFNNVDEN
jgi:hypothetical protein